MKTPSKHNEGIFKERVSILRLDYADGSFWQSAADVAPQKN
jgi:hypothetical protein